MAAVRSYTGMNVPTDVDYLFNIVADATTTANAVHIGADMTISPEGAAESGYIRVRINGVVYQIPVYAE